MWKKTIVIDHNPESEVKPLDIRFNPPFLVTHEDSGVNLLMQEFDVVDYEDSRLLYYTPNQVSIFLSIAGRNVNAAKKTRKQILRDSSERDLLAEKKVDTEKLLNNSKRVCEFFEAIQTAVVFAFTAIESFVNLSIPANYVYEKKTKRCVEQYDKSKIERYVDWKTKISTILVDIYQTPKISNEKWWGNFLLLVKLRNDIVHQKSSRDTEQLAQLFKEEIFEICVSALQVIGFFFQHTFEKKNATFVGSSNTWPILDPNNFVVRDLGETPLVYGDDLDLDAVPEEPNSVKQRGEWQNNER